VAATIAASEAGHLPNGPANSDPALDPAVPIPFEELLLPFLQVARRQLRVQAGSGHSLFSPAAWMTVERALLIRLARLAGETLMLEFSIFRDQEGSLSDELLRFAGAPPKRELYDQFVARFHANPAVFFKEYTVLARLLSVVTAQWVEAQVELLERLAVDLPEISRIFEWANLPVEVMTIQAGLSDPHRGGRQVCSLVFAGGAKVVYKPKDLGLEAAFAGLLAWVNQRGGVLPLKSLRLLNRRSHGWVEFVEHRPCADAEAGRRYYRRAGMLLGLVYLLEGNDCHLENLIAAGDQPVLVDLETVPHPFLPGFSQGVTDASNLAETMLWDSVLRTGMLPGWIWGRERGVAVDRSGLGGQAGGEDSEHRFTWIRTNTDAMEWRREPVPAQAYLNLPRLDGTPLRVDAHEAEIIAGFVELHRLLREHRHALLAEDGPLAAFGGQTARFVHRPTRTYAHILQRSLSPRCLRDGIDQSIEIDLLARVFLPGGPGSPDSKAPVCWPVVVAERIALAGGDIPFFTASTSGHELPASAGAVIRNCFPESCCERIQARLRALDEADAERQTSLIRGSFFAWRTVEVGENTAGTTPVTASEFSPEKLLGAARAIGEEIAALAIRGQDGSVEWIAPQINLETRRYQFQRLGFGMHSGAGGVSLFLGALHQVFGAGVFRELARGALQPLLETFRQPEQRRAAARVMGLGAGGGLGGVLHTLARTGMFLQDETLIAAACGAVSLVEPELATGPAPHDVLLGMAGAILGLITVHEVAGDQAALERGRRLGRVLLANRVPGPSGHRAWAGLRSPPLAGFSHGAAGIAYTLTRLYRAGRDEEFLAAAAEAVAFEQTVFDPERKNWPDLTGVRAGTPDPQGQFRVGWCHGAPGVALGRLGMLEVADNAAWRADVEVALQTTLASGLEDWDFLCCGNLGRAETLLTAARQLGRPELETVARNHAMHIVDRARGRGGFGLQSQMPKEVYNPGFLLGTSGIGYMLLRIACPDRLPSMLRWE
jgi:type 2 lantibiotic biosynthesis protein LanM